MAAETTCRSLCKVLQLCSTIGSHEGIFARIDAQETLQYRQAWQNNILLVRRCFDGG